MQQPRSGSPFRDAKTLVPFVWMNVVAISSVVVALLPLALRGRPLGRTDRRDEAAFEPVVDAPEARVAER